uniref:Uncharacterized protein n=1 Tax=Arundo donax TaxID=35708 RepID=A0A0A9CQP6_ARUDO
MFQICGGTSISRILRYVVSLLVIYWSWLSIALEPHLKPNSFNQMRLDLHLFKIFIVLHCSVGIEMVK